MIDTIAQSARSGWMPSYPQFNRSSLDVVAEAEAAVRFRNAHAEHAERRQHNRDIPDRVITRANPDGAHVRVAGAIAIEHDSDASVRRQRQRTGARHDHRQSVASHVGGSHRRL